LQTDFEYFLPVFHLLQAFRITDVQTTKRKSNTYAVTTIAVNPVLPWLRLPISAGEEDPPNGRMFKVAFKYEDSWRLAWQKSEENFFAQC
jgi:hypothetical protein